MDELLCCLNKQSRQCVSESSGVVNVAFCHAFRGLHFPGLSCDPGEIIQVKIPESWDSSYSQAGLPLFLDVCFGYQFATVFCIFATTRSDADMAPPWSSVPNLFGNNPAFRLLQSSS